MPAMDCPATRSKPSSWDRAIPSSRTRSLAAGCGPARRSPPLAPVLARRHPPGRIEAVSRGRLPTRAAVGRRERPVIPERRSRRTVATRRPALPGAETGRARAWRSWARSSSGHGPRTVPKPGRRRSLGDPQTESLPAHLEAGPAACATRRALRPSTPDSRSRHIPSSGGEPPRARRALAARRRPGVSAAVPRSSPLAPGHRSRRSAASRASTPERRWASS